jgi:two-component system cell cycle sensor histidine kinase/response regulator CckA
MLRPAENASPIKNTPLETAEMPARLRVLLIEDDHEETALTLGVVKAVPWLGADVSVSHTYAKGLKALHRRNYDIVLLDHQLGAHTGLELLGEAFGGSVDVPVVLLIGTVDHGIDAAAARAGVCYLLEKVELNPTRLERSIRYALERFQSEADLRRMRAFFRAALDALTDHVAILNEDGTILAVNDVWTRFASEIGDAGESAAVGANYLEICESASGPFAGDAADVARGVRDVIGGRRERFTFEYPCHSPTRQRWFVLRVTRFEDDGKIRVLVAHENITERREAGAALRASEERYRSLVETAHEGIGTLDGAGTITYVNARLAAMLGLAVDELIGRPLFDFMADTEQFDARTRFARRHRGIVEAEEIQFRHENGETLWLLTSYGQRHSDGELFTGVLVVLTDVTARKHAELAMAAALHTADTDRRRLEATLTAIPVGVWLSDANGQVTHANPAAVAVSGGSAPGPDGVPGYGVFKSWFPATDLPVAPADTALARTLASGQTVANELVEIERFDGTHAFVLNSAAPIRDAEGGMIGGVVVNVDVTERQAKASERERLIAQLDGDRAQLAALFDLAPSFLAVLRGPTHVFERVNAAYLRLVGHRELIGKPFLEAFPEMRGQGFDAILDGVRDTGIPFVGKHLPATIVREAGGRPETRFVTVVYQRMNDYMGQQLIVAHGWDATEEVLATEGLRRNEQRLRDQFDKLPVPTTLWELDGDDFLLRESNEEAHRGDPRLRDSVGARSGDLYPTRDPVILGNMHRCLRDNTVVRFNILHDFGGADGVRHYEVTLGPQQPDRVILHSVDTTGRAELEAQLRQAQKMEAVGQLAGGVAHDFNNILTVIEAHSSFLLDSLGADDPQREDADMIHQAGVRAAGLTRQLLAFSRKQLLRPVVTNVNAVVADASKMLARLIGVEIEIALDLANDLGLVMVDPGQLEQVLVNLALNARDAMPHGGRLSIGTQNVTYDSANVDAARIIPPGDYVVVEVRDTGVGMDAQTRTRLFEPFFTTKAPGKGTGLGLATVYGIVKQSAGYILVESALDEGTTFCVYLPRTSTDKSQEDQQAAASLIARGVETVLLIEDEAGVLEVATRVLKRQGYQVLQAQDGFQALSIASTFDAPIHLVLSDAAMPGLSGAETCRRLLALRPNLKVVMMSGYTDDEVLRRGVVLSDVVFMEKPFTAATLVRVVRQALDG